MSTESEITDAVYAAVEVGMDPKDFIRAAWLAWDQAYKDKQKHAAKVFEAALSK